MSTPHSFPELSLCAGTPPAEGEGQTLWAQTVGLLLRGDTRAVGRCWHGWLTNAHVLGDPPGTPSQAQTSPSHWSGEAEKVHGTRSLHRWQEVSRTGRQSSEGLLPGRREQKDGTHTGPWITQFMGQAECNAKSFSLFF